MYQEIKLNEIKTNPHNPRKRFEGKKFDELVESIRQKGVIEPIVLRNMKKGFEIVAGERRFRALSKVAESNGGSEACRIPAMVRDLSDDEAFEFMTIENLQREDLTEQEEAQSFKAYIEKNGDEALPELAERTGIKASYIRRRIAVFALPKKIIKEWGKGRLLYGHLEQLLRVKKNQVMELYEKIFNWDDEARPVRDLKERIDELSPNLHAGSFKKDKCKTCRFNSDVQGELFELGMKKAHCLNPACFKEKQRDYLTKNWKRTSYHKKNKTNGFVFITDVERYSWHEFYSWTRSPGKKCRSCDKFITVLEVNGKESASKVCMGDDACFKAFTSEKKKKKKDENAPRVPWHGEYFREEFFKEQIPFRFKDVPAGDEKALRIVLLSLLESNRELLTWFNEMHKVKKSGYLHAVDLFPFISEMSAEQLHEDLKSAALVVVLQDQQSADTRRIVADHIGIDLSKEYQVTKEYLQKKTIKELLAFGETSKVFQDPKAQTFLYETLLKKRKRFSSCKKAELVRVFLECGVDLKGKVPAEILAVE